jgi:Conserved hypothetical protein (DUF2461)
MTLPAWYAALITGLAVVHARFTERHAAARRMGSPNLEEPPMAVDTSRFTGFRPEAIDFLADLAQNNERSWFQARKSDYERLLKEPMEDFVAALADEFAAQRVPLQADPKRSIFRIYRDTRFAKDKSPY